MPLTEIYVDPAINANSGAGTIGSPYGDLQHALNTVTRNATDGDRFNIKAGTAEVLAAILSLATYGAPTSVAPLVIEGYTSAAGDGGVGEINANGGAAIPIAIIFMKNLYIRNGGSSTLVSLSGSAGISDSKIADTTGIGILAASGSVTFCEITDCATGISMNTSAAFVMGCYFKDGAIRNFTNSIAVAGSGATILRNIFSLGTSGNGIFLTSARHRIVGNSFLANGSTAAGITGNSNSYFAGSVILNNIIEGFSGAGGRGILNSTTPAMRFAGNAFFNNATNYSGTIDSIENLDNEVLGVTAFAKSGSNTFANRLTYFAPVNTGNIFGGAIQ